VHVKSLPAHAVRSLIIARKKLVGQRVTLENQIRGLAVVFGVRLPRGLSPAFVELAKAGSWSLRRPPRGRLIGGTERNHSY
jgi:transposase